MCLFSGLSPNMKLCLWIFVLGNFLHDASSRIHSLKYFYTASSHVPNFPEFVVVGLVDDVQMFYYDSNTKKAVPKQEWMEEATAGDPKYWERETGILLGTQLVYKNNIEVARQRLNQTEGVHIFQYMYGCEWDDETGEVRGYKQYGYDGEDFIVFDFATQTWIAPRQEAFITKLKWDKDVADNEYRNYYHTQICPDWLKKYVNFGKKTLMRTVMPSIWLLQKSSSSRVTCQATGFYPDGAMLFWSKDGEEVYEGVDLWEVLPNPDGTFQMSADLDVSSIPPEDWHRYNCVFQLSGVKEDVLTKLDPAVIRTNGKRDSPLLITLPIVAGVVLLVVVAALGIVWWKKKKGKRPPSSETLAEQQELNPTS